MKLSVITPTIGRASLEVMLQGLLPQLEGGDEVFVVGDGKQPATEAIVRKLGSARVRYSETPYVGKWGNPQRNQAMLRATGAYLFFVDDDDRVLPGAVAAMRRVLERAPARPHVFKMQHPAVILWTEKKIRAGNISGQMFVAPNIRAKLGSWSDRYEADQDFIGGTLRAWGGEGVVVWRDEVVVVQGLAGKARA